MSRPTLRQQRDALLGLLQAADVVVRTALAGIARSYDTQTDGGIDDETDALRAWLEQAGAELLTARSAVLRAHDAATGASELPPLLPGELWSASPPIAAGAWWLHAPCWGLLLAEVTGAPDHLHARCADFSMYLDEEDYWRKMGVLWWQTPITRPPTLPPPPPRGAR